MQLTSRSATFLTLTAAVILLGAAPAPAQGGIISIGHGSYLTANQQDTLHFTYFLRQTGGGSVKGYAFWRGPNTLTVFKLTSFMYIGGDTVAAAGPIVYVQGNPPTGAAVGLTAFFAAKDNGWGSQDEIARGTVPPQFGNPPIQTIIAGFPPSPSDYRLLQSGNIWIP